YEVVVARTAVHLGGHQHRQVAGAVEPDHVVPAVPESHDLVDQGGVYAAVVAVDRDHIVVAVGDLDHSATLAGDGRIRIVTAGDGQDPVGPAGRGRHAAVFQGFEAQAGLPRLRGARPALTALQAEEAGQPVGPGLAGGGRVHGRFLSGGWWRFATLS